MSLNSILYTKFCFIVALTFFANHVKLYWTPHGVMTCGKPHQLLTSLQSRCNNAHFFANAAKLHIYFSNAELVKTAETSPFAEKSSSAIQNATECLKIARHVMVLATLFCDDYCSVISFQWRHQNFCISRKCALFRLQKLQHASWRPIKCRCFYY